MFQKSLFPVIIIGPSQHCLDLGGHHHLVKGLGDKIISSHLHGHNNIHIIRGGRNKDHRYFGNLPDLLAPVIAVIERQRNIQQDQMRMVILKFLHDLLEIYSAPGFQVPGFHLLLDPPGDPRIIFYDKYTVHKTVSFPNALKVFFFLKDHPQIPF